MKRQVTVQITRAENGFTVRVQSDESGESKTLVATSPEGAVKLASEAVNTIVNPTKK